MLTKSLDKMKLFRSDHIGDYYEDDDGTIYKHRHKDGQIHVYDPEFQCWKIADYSGNPSELRFN